MQKTQGDRCCKLLQLLDAQQADQESCTMIQAEDSGRHQCTARQCYDKVQLSVIATVARSVSHDRQLWHRR